MKNRNVLIVGQIGSGKSTLTRALVDMAPRSIILDPEREYTGDAVFQDYQSAIEYFVQHRKDSSFRLVFQFEEMAEAVGLIKLAKHAQKVEDLPPLAVFLEEASEYSDTHHIDPEIADLYRKGRHWRINTVSVIQVDTDINRIVRSQSQIIVSMFQTKLSSDFLRFFTQDEILKLKTLIPGTEPVQDTHFRVIPRGLDLFHEWREINAGE